MDAARRTEMQYGGCRRYIVRSFQDKYAVVVSQGPVDFLDVRSQLFRLGPKGRRTLGCVVDVFDAPLQELDIDDESCNLSASS